MKEKPSPLAVGSPGPVRAREPLFSRKADTKLSVSAQGADWTSSSSCEAALSYTYKKDVPKLYQTLRWTAVGSLSTNSIYRLAAYQSSERACMQMGQGRESLGRGRGF